MFYFITYAFEFTVAVACIGVLVGMIYTDKTPDEWWTK